MSTTLPVFTGFWIDRSQPSVILGSTLTINVQWSSYLVSFLAWLVTLCSVFFWSIAAFALHQLIVRDDTVQVVDLQWQVILRNSETPMETLWDGFRLLLAWRKTSASLWRRASIVMIPALIVGIAFPVATIFVAEIASKDYDQIPVLVQEGTCGLFQPKPAPLTARVASSEKIISDTKNGRQYAANWYGDGGSVMAQSPFPKILLQYSNSTSTPCPWTGQCLPGDFGAFSLQSEPLDSHHDFGINAPKDQRVQFQTNVTCSPLRMENYTKQDGPWLRFEFGNTVGGPAPPSNRTYSYLMSTRNTTVGYLIL